ncbi:M28 family peptidase [Pedobacter sp. L105]|uniref:M28 family peptidase n=1 Tax=Pedobacter sp. L105 TaxID=1641871 RepID=UPI0020B14C72|nr:M28 family peptidase [Pedobacter sp. L105]
MKDSNYNIVHQFLLTLTVNKKLMLTVLTLLITVVTVSAQVVFPDDSAQIRHLYNEALDHGQSYENLRYLTSHIGARLSGSPQAEKAVLWAKLKMDALGLDHVYLQEVMVPHWIRGAKEKAAIVITGEPKISMDVCALGGSIATAGKLRAQVVEVRSWKELDEKDVKGKIVFFNRAMNPEELETFKAYLDANDQRSTGAVEAAKRGAIGTLVRSLTLSKDNLPHTGAMSYDDKIAKIPSAAISTNSADKLSSELKLSPNLTVELEMGCEQLPDVKSYNVIGEIRGSKYPEEIITVGAHIDSWDLAEAASDDGSGFVQTIEVMRIIKAMGIHPERTIRAILYINEENGNRGGLKYAETAKLAGENHLAVIEQDAGGFMPKGFRIEASPQVVAHMQLWQRLLQPYQLHILAFKQRGIDIVPMKNIAKALISVECEDQRFFDIHHSAADTFDKISRRELELGGASMVTLVYLIDKYGL